MTRFVDRQTGLVTDERVFGDAGLRFFYGTSRGRALLPLATLPLVSAAFGLAKRLPGQHRVKAFVDDLRIDASEAEHPLHAYRSVADFFVRRLRDGVRPVDRDPAHVTSPVDGRVVAAAVDASACLMVKGASVSVGDLIDGDASVFGSALVFRLAPADYHRVHAPVDGVLSPPRRRGRRLHSVHPLATNQGAPSFLNVRSIRSVQTAAFGRVDVVLVGALLVGTIVDGRDAGVVAKGDELGFFAFGGSSVVLLFERDRVVIDEDLWQNTRRGLETLVRTGTRVAAA